MSKELSSIDEKDLFELTTYIVDGFGNPTRIDYGTGHELSFCMFLCALYKVNMLKQSDSKAVVNVIFLRLILKTYCILYTHIYKKLIELIK